LPERAYDVPESEQQPRPSSASERQVRVATPELPPSEIYERDMQEMLGRMAEEGYEGDYSYGGGGMGAGMGRGGPTPDRLQQLMGNLQSGDESLMTQAVMELASELSMAQDTTMSQRYLEQLVGPLVQCLDAVAFPNIIGTRDTFHIVVYATTCLTHIMDILPPLVNKIAGMGGVTKLCQRLEGIESFELIETIIRALDKVAGEMPYAVLTANGLTCLAKIVDFFEQPQQVSILTKTCRKRY
jgi:hypothetical protein